jgi:beta-1,4-N-acetylglucosaminyltransferase
MIFVTVGNAIQGFERLLNAVERLADQGLFGCDQVVVQSGNNPGFQSIHCQVIQFLSLHAFTESIRQANLIICHAGAGTLLHVFKEGKVPVVMPRRKQYGEHIDDHQVELVEALLAESRVVPAFEPEALSTAIVEANRRNTQERPPLPSRMLGLVDEAIMQLLGSR